MTAGGPGICFVRYNDNYVLKKKKKIPDLYNVTGVIKNTATTCVAIFA